MIWLLALHIFEVLVCICVCMRICMCISVFLFVSLLLTHSLKKRHLFTSCDKSSQSMALSCTRNNISKPYTMEIPALSCNLKTFICRQKGVYVLTFFSLRLVQTHLFSCLLFLEPLLPNDRRQIQFIYSFIYVGISLVL